MNLEAGKTQLSGLKLLRRSVRTTLLAGFVNVAALVLRALMVKRDVNAIIYITLEYCEADLFSGNGVFARSQVSSLANAGINVLVICGRPSDTSHAADEPHSNISIRTLPLDIWYTTDRASSHEQFAHGTSKILQSLDWTLYDACLAVDWTSTNTIIACENDKTAAILQDASVPVIYLNFRSYSSMTNISDDDRKFYAEAERNAVQLALNTHGAIISLCHADDKTLRSLVYSSSGSSEGEGEGEGEGGNKHEGDSSCFKVLLPTLRSLFYETAQHDRGSILDPERNRSYVTSLVRLSEDKGAHRFVAMLRRMQQDDPDIWVKSGAVPLLLGAPSQPEYAARIHNELKDAVPHAVIMDTFLPPDRLAEVLKQSTLNIHPALYEAYGLTIVEAASMGCPSVVHRSGIGAAQLLKEEDNAVYFADMSNTKCAADTVRKILLDPKGRNEVAHRAYLAANSWSMEQYMQSLMRCVSERVSKARGNQ